MRLLSAATNAHARPCTPLRGHSPLPGSPPLRLALPLLWKDLVVPCALAPAPQEQQSPQLPAPSRRCVCFLFLLLPRSGGELSQHARALLLVLSLVHTPRLVSTLATPQAAHSHQSPSLPHSPFAFPSPSTPPSPLPSPFTPFPPLPPPPIPRAVPPRCARGRVRGQQIEPGPVRHLQVHEHKGRLPALAVTLPAASTLRGPVPLRSGALPLVNPGDARPLAPAPRGVGPGHHRWGVLAVRRCSPRGVLRGILLVHPWVVLPWVVLPWVVCPGFSMPVLPHGVSPVHGHRSWGGGVGVPLGGARRQRGPPLVHRGCAALRAPPPPPRVGPVQGTRGGRGSTMVMVCQPPGGLALVTCRHAALPVPSPRGVRPVHPCRVLRQGAAFLGVPLECHGCSCRGLGSLVHRWAKPLLPPAGARPAEGRRGRGRERARARCVARGGVLGVHPPWA